jgi:hypothetical protein
LIVTGTTFALIGIKNRWISIFLSTAYLVAISVLVLIDYVMHPPVSNAIQGAYFVAIVMTGCIFGGGALIFKEVTEGLGCLLGGFSLGMWFLTLRSGGVISGSTGVGILLAIFCVIGWLLFFSKYTRDYALIGSTALSGATAFTLGIDCFSRAGYKEFWLYIWNLNSDLFPLNTKTYPLTRGIRVEIAVIVIGTIVGVISQLKLWKVIRERRREKEAIRLEEESRRDAVDDTLGRHLQRQNEMAKQQWERIYGDGSKRPMSMVESIGEGHSNMGSRVSLIRTRMHSGLGPQSQVVEMRPVIARQNSSRVNRQSTLSVNAIPEENEGHEQAPDNTSTGDVSTKGLEGDVEAQAHGISGDSSPRSEPSLTFEGPTYPNTTNDTESVGSAGADPVKQATERSSLQSFLKRLSVHGANPGSGPPSPALPNISQEALIHQMAAHSRASSVAATLDEDHDRPDASRLSVFYGEATKPPAIVISPAHHNKGETRRRSLFDVPPSPPAMSVEFDPEELARPVAHGTKLDVKKSQSSLRSVSQAQTPERGGSLDGQTILEATKTTLTTSALEAVPSQLSNVVLSYRTNEWAKHATAADAPVADEPLEMGNDDEDELPTQVTLSSATDPKDESHIAAEADSTHSLSSIDKSLSATSKPPKPHVLPQREDTLKSNKFGSSVESGSLQKKDLSQNQSAVDLSRTMSKTTPTLSTERGLRSSSTPILSQSLVTSPIEENAETFFPPFTRTSTIPSPAGAAILSAQRQNLLRNQSMQRSQSQQDLPLRQSIIWSTSQQGQYPQQPPIRSPSRSSALTEDTDILLPSPALTTRLSTYNSRQPARQSTAPTPQHRESLLADFRTSMRHETHLTETPEQTMAQRRADMLAQRAMLKRSASQQSYMQASQQGAMDVIMRRGDMQDAHRAAMRRMQAKANEGV